MQRRLKLASTAMQVPTALIGAATMPAAADRGDADADDGEANANGPNQDDDEATNVDITLDGDDETTVASVRRI